MATTSKFFYVLLLVILIVGLAGCELSRDDSTFSDPGPVSDVPPTLAPLGAETDMIFAPAVL